ncbi:MAG: hypothetical protein HYZ54_07150 [Ignavibacteriae bacterium]|nr:hypothetical protein [Ignavibacteriota bacterium]
MASKSVVIGIIVIAIIVILFAVNFNASGNITDNTTGNYDNFAKCLSESGAKMYGAYWCSHCNNQKQMFGNSWKYMNYVECALSGNEQAQICTAAGVRAYPTWMFGDNRKVEGELTFQKLSEYSGCKLP